MASPLKSTLPSVLVAVVGALLALALSPAAGWGAVSFRSTASATDAAGGGTGLRTATVTKPTGTVQGDLMIATISAGCATGSTVAPALTAPSGWTQLHTYVQGTVARLSTYYHVAGSSEGASYAWSYTPNSGARGAIAAKIDVYDGADTTTPLTAGVTGNGTATTVTLPNDNASSAGSMRISLVSSFNASTASFSTSSYSAAVTMTTGQASNTATTVASVNVSSAYATQGSGTTATATATLSSTVTRWFAATYVINPGVSGLLSLAVGTYALSTVTLDGHDQNATGTIPLQVDDSTGDSAGWRVTASSTAWAGGSTGTLSASQRITTPPAPTCDGGTGTCTLATTTATWPASITSSPIVIYNATASTGMSAQTMNLPVQLPIPGNVKALGTFTQTVTFTVTSGP